MKTASHLPDITAFTAKDISPTSHTCQMCENYRQEFAVFATDIYGDQYDVWICRECLEAGLEAIKQAGGAT